MLYVHTITYRNLVPLHMHVHHFLKLVNVFMVDQKLVFWITGLDEKYAFAIDRGSNQEELIGLSSSNSEGTNRTGYESAIKINWKS